MTKQPTLTNISITFEPGYSWETSTPEFKKAMGKLIKAAIKETSPKFKKTEAKHKKRK